MDYSSELTTKRRLWLFFFLAFVISWGSVFVLTGADGFPIKEEQATVMGIAVLLGPSLAALILTSLSGYSGFKNLFSRLLKWQIGIRWYAAAFLIAPFSTVLTLGIISQFSGGFEPNILITPDKIGLAFSAILAGLIVGIFEEIGWTGFATPGMLETQSIVGTGLIIGFLWGAWHFPLFWQANSFTASLPFILLISRLLAWLPAYRILMVWVYKNTESLFIVVLMHVSLVMSLIVLDPQVEGENLISFILVRAALLWAIVAMVVAFGRKNA